MEIEKTFKTWPEYFELVVSGKKKFEIRYWNPVHWYVPSIAVGDVILLVEHERIGGRATGKATGRTCNVVVTGPFVHLADLAQSDEDERHLQGYYCFGIDARGVAGSTFRPGRGMRA